MATAKRKRTTSSSSPRRRRKSNNQGGKKFTFYAILLIIGAGAIVFYNHYVSPLPLLSTQSQQVAATKTTSKRAFVEPDYQFYTLLPQGNGAQPTVAAGKPTVAKPAATATPITVSVTKSTTAATTATPAAKTATPVAKTPAPIIAATPTAVPAPSHHYSLQLAAFKRYEDADELKAKLILQGYPTTISSATVNGTVWYRLSIGPYTTAGKAKAVQTKLEQTHLVNHTQVIQQ